jgi:hypothetical protein
VLRRDGGLMDWGRVTISLGAALIFAVGAYRVSTTDNGLDGFALLAVSLVLTGIAITLELHERWCPGSRAGAGVRRKP